GRDLSVAMGACPALLGALDGFLGLTGRRGDPGAVLLGWIQALHCKLLDGPSGSAPEALEPPSGSWIERAPEALEPPSGSWIERAPEALEPPSSPPGTQM